MNVRQRQLRYGLVIGSIAFVAGWALTWVFMPQEIVPDTPRWQETLWVWLSAQFVPISGAEVYGIGAVFQDVDLVAEEGVLESLRAIPFLITMLAGLTVIEGMGRTSQFNHLLTNSLAALVGYVSAATIAIAWSGAQPAFSLVLTIGVILGLGTLLASATVERLTGGMTTFTVVSVWTLVGIALLFVLGGSVVLYSLLPVVVVGGVGASLASVIAYAVRNTPW